MEDGDIERLNAKLNKMDQQITSLPHRHWTIIGTIGDAFSGLTSIGLLIIAWFTVIPLYQNAMLGEKNAQLERELEDKKKELNETQYNLDNTRKQVNLIDNNLQEAKTDLSATRQENQELQNLNIELVKGINTQRQEQGNLSKIIDDQHYERRALQTEIEQLKIEK